MRVNKKAVRREEIKQGRRALRFRRKQREQLVTDLRREAARFEHRRPLRSKAA
jgi:hypothetical protein